MTAPPTSLLREIGAILRDYQDRIDRLGAEAFRLRGESFESWDRKRARIAQVGRAVEVLIECPPGVEAAADALLREVAICPAATAADVARVLARRKP